MHSFIDSLFCFVICSDVLDINGVISDGWTPLVHAASAAQPLSVSFLLEHGATNNTYLAGMIYKIPGVIKLPDLRLFL